MNKRANKILTSIAIETLERLAFVLSSTEDDEEVLISDSKSASVSFTGPFSGKLVIRMSKPVLLELTANMLGIDENEATIDQQYDAIKEALNVICGNFLPVIGGRQTIFHIEAPDIIGEGKSVNEKSDNMDEDKPFALAKLSIDDELCVLYLFVDGEVSPETFMT